MDWNFKVLTQARTNLLKATANLSVEAYNHIPQGFNNNIIWNLAHCLVTQQLLMYKLSQTPMHISDDLVNAFRKGSKPERSYNESEIQAIREQLESSVEQAVIDYKNQAFGDFNPYPTSFGLELKSIDEALVFNNVHEGMHLGSILALKKLV